MGGGGGGGGGRGGGGGGGWGGGLMRGKLRELGGCGVGGGVIREGENGWIGLGDEGVTGGCWLEWGNGGQV